MTNEQAKGYMTCALYAIYRDKGRTDYGKHKASDKKLRELIKEIRSEMNWQFDTLTEQEAEERGDRIMNSL
jgi:hypothetical protein